LAGELTHRVIVNDIFDSLIAIANNTGQSVPDLLRHHLLEAVLRRLPANGEPDFVLRGSMITRLWAAPFPRIANDIDYLGTFANSVRDAAERFLPALQRDAHDGVRFDHRRCSAKGIWEESEFPGVRFTLWADVLGKEQSTTVDVGFGDPLVPPAAVAEYPLLTGDVAHVWAVHPATLIGWKLHGLAEWGESRWRPKDLLDLWLLTGRFELPPSTLAEAIRFAFVSRGYAAGDAQRTLENSCWKTFSAEVRWNAFRQKRPELPIPEAIFPTLTAVRDRLRPALDLLRS
jgi:hypothetical protein